VLSNICFTVFQDFFMSLPLRTKTGQSVKCSFQRDFPNNFLNDDFDRKLFKVNQCSSQMSTKRNLVLIFVRHSTDLYSKLNFRWQQQKQRIFQVSKLIKNRRYFHVLIFQIGVFRFKKPKSSI
jgi:hypothetical protein